MPRPTRNAKRANTASRKQEFSVPEVSPRVHSHNSTIRPKTPEPNSLSDARRNINDIIDDDSLISDEVGRTTLKDIGNQLSLSNQQYTDTDANDGSDLSLYPSPLTKASQLTATRPHQEKPVRTSELLTLLPERHTRHQTKSKSRSKTSKSQKGGAAGESTSAEKENDVYEGDSEEEMARDKRRKVAIKKFAEVDKWELQFEDIDLSFSSQG